MKLKYILGLVLAATLFAGCDDDDDTRMATFGNITIDRTYVSIPATGGDATITVKSAGAWQFDDIFMTVTNNGGVRDTTYSAMPQWLTVSTTEGAAGETKVTLHAEATDGGREAELQIVAGGNRQFIIVRQGSMEAATATCAEVIAAPDGKTFRVTGTVARIANTTYGNWYLQDETGQIYIYGTLDKNGSAGANQSIAAWGIEVGDVITVEGPKTTYNGTVELVNVTVVSLTKSLVKVESAPATVSKAGGEIEVKVSYKGAGAYFTIPEADRSWVSFVESKYISGEADTVVFRFFVQPNTGATRSTDLVFSSANSTASSSVTCTITQETAVSHPATGSGTKASPYNVTAAIAYTKALADDVESADDIYVTGIVSSVKYTYSAQYGTATYNISADGQEENVFTVYGSYFFDNQPWEEGQTQIAVGDRVVVCGKVINYKGTTPEFSNKKNWLVSLNGSTGSGTTDAEPGTLERPFTVAEAISYIDASGADDVYVEGTVSKIVYAFDVDHGTGTFWISADGEYHGDSSLDFEAYSIYWMGNKPWEDGFGQVAVGDRVVLCGKLTKYNTTYETSARKAYIYSLNGSTE